MRGILIALALVLVLAGAGVAGYLATKDDGEASPGNVLSDKPESGTPDSGTPNSGTPNSGGSATSPTAPAAPDSPDSTTSPDSGGATSPTSPASPDSGGSSGGATSPSSPASPGSGTDSKGSGKGGVITVPPARVFTGTGNKRLGTVNLRATSILRWRSKGHFEVRFGRQDFSIIAPTKSGQLIVPAFRFNRVRVVATGPWKITVTPQA